MTDQKVIDSILEAAGKATSVNFNDAIGIFYVFCPDRIQQILEEHKRMKATVEFYADRNNWRSPNYDMDCKSEITTSDLGCKSFNGENDFSDFAIPSGGRRAREALAAAGKGAG